jgi:hypothetical protein
MRTCQAFWRAAVLEPDSLGVAAKVATEWLVLCLLAGQRAFKDNDRAYLDNITRLEGLKCKHAAALGRAGVPDLDI